MEKSELSEHILSVWNNNPHREALKIIAKKYRKSPTKFTMLDTRDSLVSRLIVMADEESLPITNPKKPNWFQDWIVVDVEVANNIFCDEIIPGLKTTPKELEKYIIT
ncbi:MAG: hypothetical protein LWW87_10310, partial [Geobacteraceae bacterium]|nr:hypothetical protein [Geobacteraceae bacterium]